MSRALLIIDVQNDFTEGGALGVAGGAAVARGVSQLLHRSRPHHRSTGESGPWRLVVASRDWHDADGDNGGHFALDAEPDFVRTWPVHCVAGSHGAAYHPELDTASVDVHIKKGQGVPAYSIFEGRTEAGSSLHNLLDEHGVTDVDVVGIATDHCVRASASDALDHGLHVRILTDLVAGVDAERSAAALAELARRGAETAPSSSL